MKKITFEKMMELRDKNLNSDKKAYCIKAMSCNQIKKTFLSQYVEYRDNRYYVFCEEKKLFCYCTENQAIAEKLIRY